MRLVPGLHPHRPDPAEDFGRAAVAPGEGDARVLFGETTAVLASLNGPAHKVESANPAFLSAIGASPRVRTGVSPDSCCPSPPTRDLIGLPDRVYRPGTPRTGPRRPGPPRRPRGPRPAGP
ncbi:hypothetical protein [Streptomyces stackebrandtii]|uniref:hypothetical protein n=1 Tax=Streptomyces stackebrandtii TaxID=3051177 RepID=UPI0028DCF9F5|nr:hypothetical protein [Streptomyces sp. DSM 40976]